MKYFRVVKKIFFVYIYIYIWFGLKSEADIRFERFSQNMTIQ